ncbi:MAG: MEKHLA domain-containing protein [Candidatus Methanoperedens sp.]|nr:MEKHLA domain-containing protein [Candidatus Methanoperedens sp.]
MSSPIDEPFIIKHIGYLLNSYVRWTGRELIPPASSPSERAKGLFEQKFVVLSHGTQADPILNYGNKAALDLWELTWEEFTKMPSRLTAEPVNREDRDRLLAQVRKNGFIDTYSGVRITGSGRRFLIERGTVWNIVDENDRYIGQAATFSEWKFVG